jgi:hypothetical protein
MRPPRAFTEWVWTDPVYDLDHFFADLDPFDQRPDVPLTHISVTLVQATPESLGDSFK